LEFDRELVKAWLRAIAPTIERPAVEPRLRLTTSGLREIAPGRAGVSLDVERASTLLVNALRNGVRTVELPVLDVLPAARPETFASLGVTELVAQGKSDFSGSAPYRIQNIRAGAARMDGVLIAPGAEFSFNEQVGAIDTSNGFTEGYAIIDGRTQLEWGGGVCQVSTTVFRAAFWAGVPITERNQHSFRIRWYEVYEPIGMDAAIFTGPGGYDLRFVNDTGSWLLLEAYANIESATLTVNLYGTRPDREVRQLPVEIGNETPAPTRPRYINDPSLPAGTLRQTDTARGGLDVTVRRVVLEDGQIVRQDSFFSRFQPWPDIFVHGTGS
jgi:vancomycin resistance protein YoaR